MATGRAVVWNKTTSNEVVWRALTSEYSLWWAEYSHRGTSVRRHCPSLRKTLEGHDDRFYYPKPLAACLEGYSGRPLPATSLHRPTLWHCGVAVYHPGATALNCDAAPYETEGSATLGCEALSGTSASASEASSPDATFTTRSIACCILSRLPLAARSGRGRWACTAVTDR